MDEHSPKYDKVIKYYKFGMWNLEQVKNAVRKGWITASEYTEITGKIYEE